MKSRVDGPPTDAPTGSTSREADPEGPDPERRNDGQIQAAVDALMARSLLRNEKGQFVAGAVKTGEHSEGFWTDLAPVKANIVARVRKQLAVEDDDGRETLLNLIDGYAEAHLLRRSSFMRLCAMGGPVTNKGKVRGLLHAWGTFFDREMRAAEKLGLERRARRVKQTTRDWLLDHEHDEHDTDRRHDDQTDETSQTEADPVSMTEGPTDGRPPAHDK